VAGEAQTRSSQGVRVCKEWEGGGGENHTHTHTDNIFVIKSAVDKYLVVKTGVL
jgi:hypothetical protein